MSSKMRRRVERIIARRIILDAIAAGYDVQVHNGGDGFELPNPSRNIKEILGAMFAASEDELHFFLCGARMGWVLLVYNNDGWDVVADYTTYLEPIMKGANALAEAYSD